MPKYKEVKEEQRNEVACKKMYARQSLKSQLDKEEPEGKEKNKMDWRSARGQRMVAGYLEH